jgi:HEAT repeat protein
MDDQKLLADIQSDNRDTRFAAWRAAGEASPGVIPQLGKIMGGSAPGVSKAALEALTTMTHSVGKDVTMPNRDAVAQGLLGLTATSYELPVRIHAFRLLSDIAAESMAPAIAKSLTKADVQEDAAYCLERIPGEAPNREFLAAYKDVSDDFKARILYALGHRRAGAAVGLCLEAMQSSNLAIAMAATKAYGRIGRSGGSAPHYPDVSKLTQWERVDEMDSQLRFADAQAQEGNAAEAMRIYKMAMERPEEHWQCAGIVGLAKMRSPEAATAIYPKLKSANSRVRITAENAWKSMADAQA